ncbi:MAG: hypothetical protein DDT19_02951 [Syntrophomonadaceae bacterium]|nr:hypothetical protein [Bacillota bacterium]
MKKPVGNMGIKGHYEMPANFVGIHKLLAVIVIISLIATVGALMVIVREKQEESFQRFIESAVKNCKQVIVGHLIITPVAGCKEIGQQSSAMTFQVCKFKMMG